MRVVLELARNLRISNPDACHKLGQGEKGQETLAIGLYVALQETSFVVALAQRANDDGSDTLGRSKRAKIRGWARHV